MHTTQNPKRLITSALRSAAVAAAAAPALVFIGVAIAHADPEPVNPQPMPPGYSVDHGGPATQQPAAIVDHFLNPQPLPPGAAMQDKHKDW